MKVTPPGPGKVKNIDYPEVPCQPLRNDLKVLVVEDSYLPQVALKLILPFGRIHSPHDNFALSELVVALLKEGTTNRGSREIAEVIDQWAMEYDADVYMEKTILSLKVLRRHLERAVELLSDLVRNPVFPEQELERTVTRWRSQLVSDRSDPGFLANERLFHAFYPDHPYRKVSVQPEHLDLCTREKAQELYLKWFSPQKSYLLFAGDINLEEATRLSERYFEDWEANGTGLLDFPQPDAVRSRRILLIHRPHSVQTRLLVGLRILPRTDPRMIPVRVTNQVLGGGGSSRLFMNLREDKGYTYGAYSYLKTYSKDGLLLAGASVRTDTTRESLQEIFKEMEQLGESPPEEEELQRSKSEIIGAFIRQMETPGSIGSMELVRRFLGFPEDYYRRFIPRIRAVTAEQVKETAQEFLRASRSIAVVVADRNSVEKDLQEFGTVEIYDTKGEPLSG